MKKLLLLLIVSSFISGCGLIKKVAGYSVANFEKEQTGRFAAEISLPPERVFRKCVDVIEKQSARAININKNRRYVVADRFSRVYEYCLDSTEVGVFLTETPGGVKVEVISNNSRLASFFSAVLFEELKTIEEKDAERKAAS